MGNDIDGEAAGDKSGVVAIGMVLLLLLEHLPIIIIVDM